jgi:hypothetical protein
MSVTSHLASLFHRDLARLMRQIESFPNDEALQRTPPGITNSAGNLVLHIEGNLREYVGRQLGNLPFIRNRQMEFSPQGLRKEDLRTRVAELERSIPPIVSGLSLEQMEREYPEAVLGAAMSTQEFLIHLYGHLNWHVGQIDYLRRIITV